MSKFCTICLQNGRNALKITQNDTTNKEIIENLQKCVPEVDWNIEFEICVSCQIQLETVCAFRDLCIKSYISRQEQIKIEDEFNPDIKRSLKYISPQEQINIEDKFQLELKHTSEPQDSTSLKYICYHCNKNYMSKTTLATHIKFKHMCAPETPDKFEPCTNICDLCGATFNNKYLLKRHKRNVHATEKKFECELCDRKFASPVYLNAHKRYHSGERKHICSFCGKGYITASDLYHHEKIHANKRAYRCEICPKAFNTSSDLHKHKICVHLDRSKWKYECTFCQRRFPLKTNLDTHTKTHTGERNFLCHLCDRKCINRSVLKRHIESHSVVKSFKCHVCCQGYKYQRSLNIHLGKMHGIGDVKIPERVKKYFCNLCPKSYFANNKLQKHIRSHTGERPFQCPACDKCFIDKSYVKQHLKTAHNVIE